MYVYRKLAHSVSPPLNTSDSGDVAVHEQVDELVDSADEDQVSKQNGSCEPKAKRSRASGAKPKARRKRYVRGKQGGLRGIMKMPLEIFTEIACHIVPGDLIALIRTSKFFRQMLLRRSALPIWQRAQSNVVGLPSCPTGMSEPQYAALLFSKTCTLCGGPATAQPDPFLRARLCASCRDTKLEEVTPSYLNPRIDYRCVARSNVIKPKIKSQLSRLSGTPFYCLREDADKVARRRAKFRQDGNAEGLKTWEQGLKHTMETQAQEAHQIRSYIESTTLSWSNELHRVKQERRDAIHKRLVDLGWAEKELMFYGEDAKPWKALVEAPKLLTERVWANILPKLIPLLEANRTRVQEAEKRKRRSARRDKLDELLCKVKQEAHPYPAILITLGTDILDNTDKSSSAAVYCPNPFPETAFAFEWEPLKNLYEEENSLERLEELFNERRVDLDQHVHEWRADIEAQLVEQYGAKFDSERDSNVVVKIRGSIDSTQHLSRNTRFLLRADTIFMRKDDKANPPSVYHFPDIASSDWDEDFARFWDSSLTVPNIQPRQYLRNVEIETIAKGLLKGMNMSDVAHVELPSMGRVFVCGRCGDQKPKVWNDTLLHYHNELTDWTREDSLFPIQKTRHPIIFRNIHDLEPTTNSKPLVRILSREEAKTMATLSSTPPGQSSDSLSCLLCSMMWGSYSAPLGQMRVHLEDAHDVVNPVQGIHYKIGGFLGIMYALEETGWHSRWDAHYDAQLSKDTASEQTTGSSSANAPASE